ncbi:MAG: hypothetical protein AAB372_02710 [Patescibacteria group bacterium]
MNQVRITRLFVFAWRALFSPKSAFRVLPEEPIPYHKASIFLFFGGVCWIHLHGFLLFVEPPWSSLARAVLYSLVFGVMPILAWRLPALFLYELNRRFGAMKASLIQVEYGMFALVSVWLIMPILDIPHLWLSQIPIILPLLGYHTLHFSHIFAGIVLTYELWFFLGVLFRGYRVIVFTIAILAFPFAKLVVEDIPFFIERLLFLGGVIDGKYDDAVAGAVVQPFFIVTYFLVRSFVTRESFRRNIMRGFLASGLFVVCALPFLIGQDPLYPGFVTDSGVLNSMRDQRRKSKNFLFAGVLHDIPTSSRVTCRVHFLKGTFQTKAGDTPRARCDLLVSGTEKGLIGTEWRALRGDSFQTTAWDDREALARIRDKLLDVRVFVETDAGDAVFFSGIEIETD